MRVSFDNCQLNTHKDFSQLKFIINLVTNLCLPTTVEGIGYDFYPTVFDKKLIDQWVKTKDDDSFKLSRELILEEGLLCGGSSGSAFFATLQAAKSLNENQRVVVVLPDGIRNYMTKFVNDEWMVQRNFVVPEDKLIIPSLHSQPISQLLETGSKITIEEGAKLVDAVSLMKKSGLEQLPVVRKENGNLLGVITVQQAMSGIVNQKLKFEDQVTSCLTQDFPKVTADESVGKLSRLLKRFKFVVVVSRGEHHELVQAVLTQFDVLNHLMNSK